MLLKKLNWMDVRYLNDRRTNYNMNIMFLIFSFNVGGIERLIIDMANGMVKCGNSITICIINDDYDPDLLKKFDAQVNTVILGRKQGSKSYLSYMLKLSKIIKEKKLKSFIVKE